MMKTTAAVTSEKTRTMARKIPLVIHHRDPGDIAGHIFIFPERQAGQLGMVILPDLPRFFTVWKGDARRDHARRHLLIMR